MTTTDNAPAPPPTTHADDRELGYGAADARPDIGDSEAGPGALVSPSGEVAGAMNSGGQSSGEDYADSDKPNATNTRDVTHDRAS